MSIDKTLYTLSKSILSNWDYFEVTGEDRKAFLQGQTTNDVESLTTKYSHLNTRLDRNGRVVSFFILANIGNSYLLLVPSETSEKLIVDLEKFIIMEDVTIQKKKFDVTVIVGPAAHKYNSIDKIFYGSYLGEQAAFIYNKADFKDIRDLKEQEKETLEVISAWPIWNKNIQENTLLNNSTLNDVAISYNKGCFLGQETVSKINNGRGAASFPTLLVVESVVTMTLSLNDSIFIGLKKVAKFISMTTLQNKTILQVLLNREYRVENKEIEFNTKDNNTFKAKIVYAPYFKDTSAKARANDIYHNAVDVFHKEGEESAISLLKYSIELDPGLSDAYETLGVIYGRLDMYEKAIEIMDELLVVDKGSVMAHTNKSLFFMKLGKIEEAEEEKSQATLKSFAKFGEEAKVKRAAKDLEDQEEAELKQRESMFIQVLEIDAEDTIANYGMGDIFFKRKSYNESIDHLEVVIKFDPKYSMAYLVLGKSLEFSGKIDQAREIYSKGIEVASKQGNMMPANEMQARLIKLV